jgi:hypothetical protein
LKVIDEAIEDRRNQLSTLGTTGTLTKSGSADKPDSLDDLKSLRDRFVARRDDIQQEARDLNDRLIRLEFFRKERDESRLLLDETRRALEQVRVESRHSLPGTVEIKSRGNVPAGPASNKRLAFAMAGGGFGSFSGIAAVVAFGFVFRRYRYTDDLSAGRPEADLVGVLPVVREGQPDRDPAFARAIHRLRINLQLKSRHHRGGQIIVVTGPRRGAGSSTTALALAGAFNQARQQTVLVDADFTEAQLTTRLGLTGVAGVREALLDGHLNGQLPEGPTGVLRTLPLGAADHFSDEHVSHRPLADLCQQLRSRCDQVIVDVGPLSERLVARLAAALADQVLFVVPAGEAAGTVDPVLDELARLAPGRVHSILNSAAADDPLIITL